MVEKQTIYLDYGATTPMDERVWQSMQAYFSHNFGNPSSVHRHGQQAEAALEAARASMARRLNAQPDEIIFTSGGTESDNLALRGAAFAARRDRDANHILISAVEHDAVSRTAEQLANVHGFDLDYIPVDEFGMVLPEALAALLREDTAIVSVIHANNEIGTINPIADLAAICREKGAPLHTDSVQAGAYLPIDLQSLGVDMLSLGAHKFYGPKGVGALFIRAGTNLVANQTGGSHEENLRAGTQNTPYIVGMATAFDMVQGDIEARAEKLRSLRDRIITGVLAAVPDSQLTGHPSLRLPQHASFVFRGVDGNALLMLLDGAGFACSSGSACKTGDPEPSAILNALGLSPEWGLGSLRVTVGVHTTSGEIDAFLAALPELVARCRSLESEPEAA